MRSEQSRFRSLYSVDPFDTSRFDFVIDTSRQNPHSVAVAIFDAYRKWINSEHWQPQRNEVPLGYSFKNQY
jgi:cytidylate kinase